MRSGFIFYKQLLALLLLSSVSISTFAQAKKPASGTQPKAPTACSGTWTGNITVSKSHSINETKEIPRVSARGTDKRRIEMNFNYKASVAVLEDPNQPGSNIGKASIESKLKHVDATTAREENSCDKGKTWRVMTGTFETKTETRGQASYQEANVTVGINSDGTYGVSVGLPPIEGITSGKQTAQYSGQCSPKQGGTTDYPQSTASISGYSLQSNGKDRVDPKDPNTLSGSYSRSAMGATETITWNLKKCGAPLRISVLQLEDMKFPNWNDWQPISDQTGTVDGNFVRITAKVLNTSGEDKYADLRFKETYKGDKWDGGRPDAPLEDSVRSVRVKANSEESIEMIWNSQGYAWFDDGRPRLIQRIRAELEENAKKVDEQTKNLKVVPKPIVFVPGAFTNPEHFEVYQNLLTTTHSYGWKTYRAIDVSRQGTIAGEGQVAAAKSGGKSVHENAENLEKYIENVRSQLNAWHVDMLSHSTGGLVARLYIHKQMEKVDDGLPTVRKLMMMGSPNLGMPCADSISYSDKFKDNPLTAKELLPEEIAIFNKHVTEKKGTKFSALVGNSVPVLCTGVAWNDGFVSVESAKYTADDFATTQSAHSGMINTKTFNDFVKPNVIIGPQGKPPFPVLSEN